MITVREWAWPYGVKNWSYWFYFFCNFHFSIIETCWISSLHLSDVGAACFRSQMSNMNVAWKMRIKILSKPKTFLLVKATIDTSWFDNDPHTSFKPLWRPLVTEVIVNMRVNWCYDSIIQDFSPIQTCKTHPKYFHIAIYKGFDLWLSAVASMFMFVVALSGPK